MKPATFAAYLSYDRDPVIHPTGMRADVASGPMSPWLRFNRNRELIYVTDIDGNPKALTRPQANTYLAIKRLAGTGVRVTMRALAQHLGYAVSTVSRAATKLASLGLVAYQSNRGRYGGTVFVLRRTGDGLEWCRDAAKATVRRWAKATAERFSRLISNVAPYPFEEMSRRNSGLSTSYSLGRNIKTAAAWTPEELREMGII